jgi:uncharacterized membrane protein AbrB (regulator of aidB expression)
MLGIVATRLDRSVGSVMATGVVTILRVLVRKALSSLILRALLSSFPRLDNTTSNLAVDTAGEDLVIF